MVSAACFTQQVCPVPSRVSSVRTMDEWAPCMAVCEVYSTAEVCLHHCQPCLGHVHMCVIYFLLVLFCVYMCIGVHARGQPPLYSPPCLLKWFLTRPFLWCELKESDTPPPHTHILPPTPQVLMPGFLTWVLDAEFKSPFCSASSMLSKVQPWTTPTSSTFFPYEQWYLGKGRGYDGWGTDVSGRRRAKTSSVLCSGLEDHSYNVS